MDKLKLSNKNALIFTVSVIILAILSISESFLILIVNKKNSNEVEFFQENKQTVTKLNSIYVKLSKYHDCLTKADNSIDAFYECKIINYSKMNFTNWQVELKLKHKLIASNVWNAAADFNENTICTRSISDISSIINKNSSYSFEVYLNSKQPIEFDSIKITGNYIYKLGDYPIHTINIVLGSTILLILIIYTLVYSYTKREFNVLKRINERAYTIIDETMKTFVNFIDAKDEYTKGHSTRVAKYSKLIAERMGLNKQFQQDIYYMGLMHDIGKITVPSSILNKTTHLTPDEWGIIKMHTENGANLLKNFTAIPGIREAILYHHERFDGKGYMAQLKGKEIPLSARIICVADSFDAMNTNRCYRLKYSKARIIKEFERCAGKQFDPEISVIMIKLIREGKIQ